MILSSGVPSCVSIVHGRSVELGSRSLSDRSQTGTLERVPIRLGPLPDDRLGNPVLRTCGLRVVPLRWKRLQRFCHRCGDDCRFDRVGSGSSASTTLIDTTAKLLERAAACCVHYTVFAFNGFYSLCLRSRTEEPSPGGSPMTLAPEHPFPQATGSTLDPFGVNFWINFGSALGHSLVIRPTAEQKGIPR